MVGWHHDNANWQPCACVVCGCEYTRRSGAQKFCSTKCRGKWKYISGAETTETQYKRISGNWRRYLSRLLCSNGRKRDQLTQEILLAVLEKQGYRCALSGVPLTCQLENGVQTDTNASVDRIVAGGSYAEENIQLVCRVLNHFRVETPIPEYVGWCRKVVAYADFKANLQAAAAGEQEHDHAKIA